MSKTVTQKYRTEISLLKELHTRSMSLPELLDVVDASVPTLRRALRELERKGLVKLIGTRESTGGRPASVYGINGGVGYTIGVHLELPQIHFVVANLTGEVLEHRRVSHDYDINANEALQQIIHFIEQARQRYGEAGLIGVGIASPGYLDSSGTVLAIGRDPAWRNVPLADRLRQETNLPVMVSNDVDCMAQAELELDKTITLDDFLYLGFTEGVKASLVLNGDLYAGPFGNAGSIGHTTVAPEGPRCTCGNRGCLEAVASVRSVHQALERRLPGQDPAGRLHQIAAIENRVERFHAICAAAAAGEPACAEIVTQVLYYLSIAIANLVNIFQVRMVIIGGLLSQLPDPLRRELDQSIRARLVGLLRDNLTIRYARDDREYNAAAGAAQRFVNEYLATFVNRELIPG